MQSRTPTECAKVSTGLGQRGVNRAWMKLDENTEEIIQRINGLGHELKKKRKEKKNAADC